MNEWIEKDSPGQSPTWQVRLSWRMRWNLQPQNGSLASALAIHYSTAFDSFLPTFISNKPSITMIATQFSGAALKPTMAKKAMSKKMTTAALFKKSTAAPAKVC
jgi:hypothetical protein